MKKYSKLNFLTCQMILGVFLSAAQVQISVAQPVISVTESVDAIIQDAKMHGFAPGKLKSMKKKDLKIHQPYTGHTEAIGYAGKGGTKILFYHTNQTWDHFDDGIKIWDVATQLAENLGMSRFIQSGFHNSTQRSSSTYFLNMAMTTKSGEFYALLTFSEFEGKLLYGLYIMPQTGTEEWNDTSEDILRSQIMARH
jgi:hypothetical protein